jgi:hypothetical protein
MSHDDGVVFWEREHPARRAVRVTRVDDGLVVTSVCPQCQVETDWPISVVRPGPARSGDSSVDVVSGAEIPSGSYVVCACGYPHEKRPPEADETGCGAYWRVSDPEP